MFKVSETCSATPGPTRPSNSNGDIGNPIERIALSATSGGVPSSIASVISPMKRVNKRFTTKPGASFVITIVFFNSLPTLTAVAVVASSVLLVRATSRSGMIATGLKKWNPTTRSGFFNPSLMASTESEEVLVARTHSGDTMDSNFLNRSCFSESSSKIASITKSHPAKTL
ncbi:unannotated protein [freshwater metagenome]|uniref:Unannotated protein n=1 Tax=freshwater metagenome TaxID=449393 RepID=A0A6J6I7V9_9ZZZZ